MTRSPEPLAKSLGHVFNDPTLFLQALTHRSAGSRNNERLEFLGDAVLGCVIAVELYQRYPQAKEGELSRLRSNLVKGESLAAIAKGLEIGQYLKLGAGERKSGGHRRDSILSDAMEALFGAIYLDAGFAACQQCILVQFAGRLEQLPEVAALKDAKTRLQEYLQSQHKSLPEYTITETSGDAHARSFRVVCVLNDMHVPPSHGQGKSRRHAEQDAAEQMLARLVAG